MRKVIANEWMTLDGVVQAPSYADEETTGGFEHGGWHTRYFDELSMRWVIENVGGAGGFSARARHVRDVRRPLAERVGGGAGARRAVNALPKYVASTTLGEPLEWQNSTLLRGDLREAVSALKSEEGRDLHVIGSPGLVQSLTEHGLVDELRLMIDPLVVGGGKRLFRDDSALRSLRLVESQVTTTSAIIATRRQADQNADRGARGDGRADVRRVSHRRDIEDAVQEAMLAATQQWPRRGAPDNPVGWLIHVASRRMVDQARSETARRNREELAAAREPREPRPAPDHDDTLALMFMSCHPELPPASAIALTLRAVGGLPRPRSPTRSSCPRPRWRSGSAAPSRGSRPRRSRSGCRAVRSGQNACVRSCMCST